MNEGMMYAGRNVDVIDIRALFDIGHDLPHIFDLEVAWPERRRINAISDEFREIRFSNFDVFVTCFFKYLSTVLFSVRVS